MSPHSGPKGRRGSAFLQVGATLFVGALLLLAVESAAVLALSAPSFEGLRERAIFIGVELGAALALGGVVALAGAVLAALLAGLGPVRLAWALALLATPPSIYLGQAVFRGPRAQRIAGHGVLALGLAFVGVACVYALARIAARLGPRLVDPQARRLRGALTGVAFLGLVVLQLADQRVLARLYPFFHRGLELCGLALAGIFVAVARAPRAPRAGLSASRLAVFLLGMGVLGVGAVLVGGGLDRAVTTVLLERAPLGGTLAHALFRLRSDPARPATPSAPEPEDTPVLLPPGPRLGSRDVLLVTIDALRADRLTASIMPRAAALADRGVRFDEAYTQVPHTSFAVASLLTGKHVYSLSALGLDAASHETLGQIMRRERWKTAAFFPPAVFFIDHERLLPLEKSAYGFEYVKYEYLDAAKRTDQVIDFFEREHPSRAFVWVHYLEPHEPYELQPGYTAGSANGPPAEPDRPEAQVRYEGEIRRVDAELGRLLDYMAKHRPGALVVICADHGEEFGEHGGRYHGTTLFDEQLRVPLVFSLADAPSGALLPARRVPGPVGLVDVAPTILALLGIPSSAKVRGRDLSPWMAAAPLSVPRGPIFAEIDRKKMVVDGRYKLACDLELGRCALYDRRVDPAERRDFAGAEPAVYARLRAELDRFMTGESRFEQREALEPGLARLFERGRLGEGAVAPELILRLPSMATSTRRDALLLLASMPQAAARLSLQGESEEEGALLDLLRARAGDAAAKTRLVGLLDGRERPWLTSSLEAQLALASGDLAAIARVIERIDDKPLVAALADALAKSHEPRVLGSLQIALAPVRSRAEVAAAIGELGDAKAIEGLIRWLPNDPYVPVRVEMVRALDRLARSGDDRARVRAAFGALLATEAEAPVLRALASALGAGRYGSVEVRALAGAVSLPVAAKRTQRIVLTEAPLSDASIPIVDGAARLPGGPLRLSAAGGAWLLTRPAP